MTSILDTNELVKFLNKNPDIGMNQLLFCLLHLHDEQFKKRRGLTRIDRPLSILYAYIDSHSYKDDNKNVIKPFTKSEIEALVDKGYINKLGKNITIDMIQVTRKFKEEFFGNYKFEEFYEEYPSFMPNFNHPSHPDIKLKAPDKDKMENLYLSKIKTQAAHERVMEILRWAIDREQINVNIETFIRSEMWEQLDKAKHASSSGGVEL